ncbi:hypothetical protein [Endozoicomonas sp. Mp262]|uniref:hypothetical protein n=1 Tax=Endozoicomonas sp. Mp262 TaxID=2919499 RepID=UPI0021DA3016
MKFYYQNITWLHGVIKEVFLRFLNFIFFVIYSAFAFSFGEGRWFVLMKDIDIHSTKYLPPKSLVWTGEEYEEGAPFFIVHGDCFGEPEFDCFYQHVGDEIKSWRTLYQKNITSYLVKGCEKYILARQAVELLDVYIREHGLSSKNCVFSFSHEGRLISFTQYEKFDFLGKINILRCVSAPENVLSERPKYKRANLAVNISIFHYAYNHGFQEITITPVTPPSKYQAVFLGFKPKEYLWLLQISGKNSGR